MTKRERVAIEPQWVLSWSEVRCGRMGVKKCRSIRMPWTDIHWQRGVCRCLRGTWVFFVAQNIHHWPYFRFRWCLLIWTIVTSSFYAVVVCCCFCVMFKIFVFIVWFISIAVCFLVLKSVFDGSPCSVFRVRCIVGCVIWIIEFTNIAMVRIVIIYDTYDAVKCLPVRCSPL